MRRWLYISAVMWMLAGSLPVGCMLTGCKGACGSMGTCGCSCRHACGGLADARRTLAVADSLRLNAGAAYDDSLALAEAYEVFGRYRLVCPDDYARTCYYYGRLLRNRGHQVGAMQAFIRGTHAPYIQRLIPLPWFSDYHILGRIYSNIGTMCHLAKEFELSYDMYEISTDCFYRKGDTTAYYYGLNSMAFELAEMKSYDKTQTLLHAIEQNCKNVDVLTKTLETRAQLYIKIEQYDSAITTAKELYEHQYRPLTGYVMMAQAFWSLRQYDSAVYYAKVVMDSPSATNEDKYSMLYILTYNDSTINMHELKQRSEERSDINRYVLDPMKQQLTQAVDLLRQDLDKKRPYLNLALFLFTLCMIGGLAWLTIHRIKLQHHHSLITLHAERQETEQLNKQMTARQEQIVQEIETACYSIRHSADWKKELQWNDFDKLCTIINRRFFVLADKLKATRKLDEKEIRLCILVLLDMFTNDELASTLYYGRGIRTFKSRVNAKLGNKGNDLRQKLVQMAVFYPVSPSEK